MSLQSMLEPNEDARCEVCGCTELEACPGGCARDRRFARAGRAVCTSCTDKATPIRRRTRKGKKR
jgi:hypothetical protein